MEGDGAVTNDTEKGDEKEVEGDGDEVEGDNEGGEEEKAAEEEAVGEGDIEVIVVLPNKPLLQVFIVQSIFHFRKQ